MTCKETDCDDPAACPFCGCCGRHCYCEDAPPAGPAPPPWDGEDIGDWPETGDE